MSLVGRRLGACHLWHRRSGRVLPWSQREGGRDSWRRLIALPAMPQRTPHFVIGGTSVAQARPQPTARIIGGIGATPHRYDFMASLLSWGTHACGATLLSPTHALTAAHCISPPWVSSGRYELAVFRHNFSLAASDDHACAQQLQVSAAVVHPRYRSTNFESDIAVLTIAPILGHLSCQDLAAAAYPTLDVVTEPHAGREALAMGWGSTSYNASTQSEGPTSSVLREVRLPVHSDAACAARLSGYVQPEMTCAGVLSGGRDTCTGDSGGPLLLSPVSNGGRYMLIGVSSWGYGCALPNRPGVFVRLSHYRSWIVESANLWPPPSSPPSSPPSLPPSSPPSSPSSPPPLPPPRSPPSPPPSRLPSWPPSPPPWWPLVPPPLPPPSSTNSSLSPPSPPPPLMPPFEPLGQPSSALFGSPLLLAALGAPASLLLIVAALLLVWCCVLRRRRPPTFKPPPRPQELAIKVCSEGSIDGGGDAPVVRGGGDSGGDADAVDVQLELVTQPYDRAALPSDGRVTTGATSREASRANGEVHSLSQLHRIEYALSDSDDDLNGEDAARRTRHVRQLRPNARSH